MATTGIIQRRDLKSALLNGIPTDPQAQWTGPIVIGEFVYATDTDEIGFVADSSNPTVIAWRKMSDLGTSIQIVHKGTEDPNTLTAFGQTGDNFMRQYQKIVVNDFTLSLAAESGAN